MNIKNIIIVLIITAFVSCSNVSEEKNETSNWNHKVLVEEVIQTSSYTYLLVSENGSSYWIAVGRMQAQPKDVYYFNSGLEMVDFKSKELDRVFDKLLLVQVISDGKAESIIKDKPSTVVKKASPKSSPTVSLESAEDMGVVTLTELFNNSGNYGGKKITVSGKVVKFNAGIMGRNWIHIVDGVSDYDLTITTDAVVKIDDKVTFDGIITLNKDFGAGYKYDIIMENAILK